MVATRRSEKKTAYQVGNRVEILTSEGITYGRLVRKITLGSILDRQDSLLASAEALAESDRRKKEAVDHWMVVVDGFDEESPFSENSFGKTVEDVVLPGISLPPASVETSESSDETVTSSKPSHNNNNKTDPPTKNAKDLGVPMPARRNNQNNNSNNNTSLKPPPQHPQHPGAAQLHTATTANGATNNVTISVTHNGTTQQRHHHEKTERKTAPRTATPPAAASAPALSVSKAFTGMQMATSTTAVTASCTKPLPPKRKKKSSMKPPPPTAALRGHRSARNHHRSASPPPRVNTRSSGQVLFSATDNVDTLLKQHRPPRNCSGKNKRGNKRQASSKAAEERSNVVKVPMQTGILYLYRGKRRSAKFVPLK